MNAINLSALGHADLLISIISGQTPDEMIEDAVAECLRRMSGAVADVAAVKVARKPRKAVSADLAPSWWFTGCHKPGKAGVACPRKIKAAQAAWDAASPEYRAFCCEARPYTVSVADWPACPERDAKLARDAAIIAREEEDYGLWVADLEKWGGDHMARAAAVRTAPTRKRGAKGWEETEDQHATRVRAYMNEAAEQARNKARAMRRELGKAA